MFFPDISHYHPVLDWFVVKQNVGFLISKATQGTEYTDPTLNSFIEGCEQNKTPYWLYTYLNKGSETTQTQFLLSQCQNRVGECFVGYVLDVEAGNDSSNIFQALQFLSDKAEKCMIYTAYKDYEKYGNILKTLPNNCAWWEARYGKNNGYYNESYPCHVNVDLHQYTDKGDCPGISGKADLNRLTGHKSLEWFIERKAGEKQEDASENIMDLVAKTMQNVYGGGERRKQLLGSNYEAVQNVINHVAKTSDEVLANEVLQGIYGNGEKRKQILGDRWESVQDIVNQQSKATAIYYVIRAGDTLSKIAERNNTTVKKLSELNGIKNVNLIYKGQKIRIK